MRSNQTQLHLQVQYAKPIKKNIEKINKLYDEGNTIVYWTARGSRTNINWYDLTNAQLDEWGAKHHELRVDKPYYDLFIDDKNMRIEEI
jgi:hypothetical protein